MTRPADFEAYEDEADDAPEAYAPGQDEPAKTGDGPATRAPETLRRRLGAGGRIDDPFFFYLLALALSIGLISLPAGQHDLRFTLLWLTLAGFGVLAWLLGDTARIGREHPEDLAWGLVFALILSGPLLAFGDSTLGTISQRLFGALRNASVLTLLVFAMPLAETLFFRGALQQRYSFWLTGLMASLWSVLLFLPVLEMLRFPAIALIVALALLLMNLLYSYVRQRNGLAAAWFCQIGVNLALLFLPLVASRGG